MELQKKLSILSDSAKYDASCASGKSGDPNASGICHSWSSDGRCVSLLKILMTNICEFDCNYCINRKSSDVQRAIFTPREIAKLTSDFYKRNYIEGLFLSSGVVKNVDYTTERMIDSIEILRREFNFRGYVHLKLIPGADPFLIKKAMESADRVSVNVELPSSNSLELLAPDKSKEKIFNSMKTGRDVISEKRGTLTTTMTTQMIVGATDDSDKKIISLSENFYKRSFLKRVYYSAYIPVNEGKNLPATTSAPPLLREHRLYQTDWLLRFYGFNAEEIFKNRTTLDYSLDPKSDWALHSLGKFPLEINEAPYEDLLRVPGVGVRSALRIVKARRVGKLKKEDLKKLGVVLKRARYFLKVGGKYLGAVRFDYEPIKRSLLGVDKKRLVQPSLFEFNESFKEAITGEL